MKDSTKTTWILLSALVPLEILSAFLAYETLGEIDAVLYFLATLLNVPIILLTKRKITTRMLALTFLAFALLPYQLYLAKRLFDVQEEASLIVAYAYSQKILNGEYPIDLSDYKFTNEKTKQFIQEYKSYKKIDQFMVTYRVGTTSTSHWYDNKNGWDYYPD